MLRILLVNDNAQLLAQLREALLVHGDEVFSAATSCDLNQAVEQYSPDIIIIDAESPSRDTLEQLCVLNESAPRPIVMFTGEHDQKVIRSAVQAGVTAYVVDGLNPTRIKPVMDVAIARFQEEQQLRKKLDESERKLAERKLVDQAKAILMSKRGLTEDVAYKLLRSYAMERGQRMGEVARQLIDASKLLG